MGRGSRRGGEGLHGSALEPQLYSHREMLESCGAHLRQDTSLGLVLLLFSAVARSSRREKRLGCCWPFSLPISTSNSLCQGHFLVPAVQSWLQGTANPQLPRINTCDRYRRAIRPRSAQQRDRSNYGHPIKTDSARSIYSNAGNWFIFFPFLERFSPSLHGPFSRLQPQPAVNFGGGILCSEPLLFPMIMN